MSAASEIYALLKGYLPTYPVTPVIQGQEIDPPAVVYDYDQAAVLVKNGNLPDEIILSVFIYDQDHAPAIDAADTLRAAMECTQTASIKKITYNSQVQQFGEPLYVVIQQYELKIKI